MPAICVSTPLAPYSRQGLNLERLAAGDRSADVDAVAANVHQRAAAKLRLQADVVRLGEAKRKGAADHVRLADGAPPHQLHDLGGTRVESIHERLHQLHTAGVRSLLHLGALLRGEGQRLLAEHVLTVLCSTNRPLSMHAVGQRNVDGIDVFLQPTGPRSCRTIVGCWRLGANAFAAAAMRLATATSSPLSDAWIAGFTAARPMFAVLITPQRSFRSLTGCLPVPCRPRRPAQSPNRSEGRRR